LKLLKNDYDDIIQTLYKEVAKQLIPTILFPSDTECREEAEKYLADHAPQYMDSIGQNNWLSKFSEKILPEVSEILQPLMIIKGMLIFFFCFRSRLNVGARETTLQQTSVMQCLPRSEMKNWSVSTVQLLQSSWLSGRRVKRPVQHMAKFSQTMNFLQESALMFLSSTRKKNYLRCTAHIFFQYAIYF